MDSQLVLTGVVSLFAGIIAGLGVFYMYGVLQGEKKKQAIKKEADRILNRAKSKAGKIERDAKTKSKDFEQRANRNAENEIRKQKQKLNQQVNQLKDKENNLSKEAKRKEEEFQQRMQELEEKSERIAIAEERVDSLEKEVVKEKNALQSKLEGFASMSAEQAKTELTKSLEEEARKAAESTLQQIEEDAKKDASKRAKQVLASAISRYASEVATERTVSIIGLTSDEMKGKIIGREGRNIRALEAACGVDLIVDETPESVVISSFDPVRREIARETLKRLMEDGRVHPARIEEVVSKVKSDIASTIKEDGEKACNELNLTNVHPAILNLLGSLKYRSSHMQNLYKQSIEVGYIAGLLAAEIGAKVQWAQRAGLLHALGRAIDHTVEGSYAEVGAEFAKRHGEKDFVCQAIRCHSGEKQAISVLDNLVQAAFNLTEARPGSKRSMMEGFIKRLKDLESIGNSFDGVSRTFAVQSGKEVRVLVDSGKITDDQSKMLVRDIARKIERELNYPGQIKISVVRETRLVEHAR